MRERRRQEHFLENLTPKKKRLCGGSCKAAIPHAEEQLVVWIDFLRANDHVVISSKRLLSLVRVNLRDLQLVEYGWKGFSREMVFIMLKDSC